MPWEGLPRPRRPCWAEAEKTPPSRSFSTLRVTRCIAHLAHPPLFSSDRCPRLGAAPVSAAARAWLHGRSGVTCFPNLGSSVADWSGIDFRPNPSFCEARFGEILSTRMPRGARRTGEMTSRRARGIGAKERRPRAPRSATARGGSARRRREGGQEGGARGHQGRCGGEEEEMEGGTRAIGAAAGRAQLEAGRLGSAAGSSLRAQQRALRSGR